MVFFRLPLLTFEPVLTEAAPNSIWPEKSSHWIPISEFTAVAGTK
jgi:hypothetical protein